MLNPIRMTEFGLKGLLRFLWRAKSWIIGVTALLLVIAATGLYVLGSTCGCGSNVQEASIQMGHIEQSLDSYYVRTSPHEYPRALEQLVDKKIMKEIPRDPWGQRYVYFSTSATQFVLVSAGPDGKLATGDDITNEGSQMGRYNPSGSNWADELLRTE